MIVTIIPNFALFSYFTTDCFHYKLYKNLARRLKTQEGIVFPRQGIAWRAQDCWIPLTGIRYCATYSVVVFGEVVLFNVMSAGYEVDRLFR